jgi:hypothetical protein
MGMRLHGSVLPGLRQRAGANFVHDHDVQGALVAAVASDGFANLCSPLCATSAGARCEKHTASNYPNYRNNFALDESFDIGCAIALPGLIPLVLRDVNR